MSGSGSLATPQARSTVDQSGGGGPVRAPAVPRREPLGSVPRPDGGTGVLPLDGVLVGGMLARQAEWTPVGGMVVATGEAPFLDATARISLGEDGRPDGWVEVTSSVRVLGLPVATVRWSSSGWDGSTPLPLPTATLVGPTVRITGLEGMSVQVAPGLAGSGTPSGGLVPGGAPAVNGPPGGAAPGMDLTVTVALDTVTEPLPEPIAVLLGSLLGADLSGLVVATGARAGAVARAAGAPAVVEDGAVAFAPGAYAPESPAGAPLLDRVARAWLAGVPGPVRMDEPVEDLVPRSGTFVVPSVPSVPSVPAVPAVPLPIAEAEVAAEPGVAADVDAAAVPAESDPAPVDSGAGEVGAATTSAVAEGAGVELLMPPAPAAPGPAAQARAGAVGAGVGATAARAATLPSADATVDTARGAVTEPAAETAARAGAALADALGERPPPSPEIVALCDRIRTAIRERRPADEDELTSADPQGAAREAGQTLSTSVADDAARVQGSYAELDTAPAGTPAGTPTPIDSPAPAVPGPGVDAATAAPDPVPAADLSLDADRDRVEQQAADARIERESTEPLQSTPPFSTVREGRAELADTAENGPAQVAEQQVAAIAQAQGDMAALQQRAVEALNASRGSTVAGVVNGQTGMIGQEEQTRESVSRQAQQIFDGARTRVDELLTPMSRTALARWDAGVARLSQQFRDRLGEVRRWIDQRHAGVGGAIVGLWDAVTGLPDWVTEEYNAAETRFGDGVCELLLSISADVNGIIAAAEAVIDDARTRIRELFDSLPEELQAWAATELRRFETQLDGLRDRAQQARTEFVTDVSRRATQAVTQVQAEVEQLRTAARGLIGQVMDAIAAFIDDPVRAIINGLLSLAGIPPASFWALVEKIGQVIDGIADNPKTFVNNLVAALRLGFEQFFDHFGTHVLNGFWAWLFSGLGSVGVQIPADFSLGSIVTFILQVMGLTWPRIREILVRHIGAQNVEIIEKAWELISLLIERGPAGLVEMLRERLDPATIVRTILEAAVDFLVEALIRQVTIRVLGMLNPAGAVLQAIELIYRVLRWVFENAARIFALVETVVNGAADILAGRIGQVATAVEMSLARLIPPVIDFLAGLLGLGDLPEQIAGVIGRLQTMVLGVVERVIVALVVRGRALLAALGVGGGPSGPGGRDGDEELGTTVRFGAGGESHRLWVGLSGENTTLMVASTPTPIPEKITQWRAKIAAGEPADAAARQEAGRLLDQLGTMTDAADQEGDRLAREFLRARADRNDQHAPPSDDNLENRERAISGMLRQLFQLFGEQGSDEAYLMDIAANLPRHGRGFATGSVHSEWWRLQIEKVVVDPPAPGGGPTLWNQTVLTDSLATPLELLGTPDMHQSLLGYFHAESGQRTRRTAEAEAFQGHALRTESPDPPHNVRRRFLDALGPAAAEKLKQTAASRLTGDVNSQLAEQVRQIGYDGNQGRYGRFSPWPTDEVNPFLRAAVAAAGGVLSFLRQMVEQQPVGQLTWERFATLWAAGGETVTWLKDQFRAEAPRSHEWIPTNWIPEVVGHAVALARADASALGTALQWLTVHHELRSPTNYVLLRPVFTPGADGGAARLEVRGHVGSFSTDAAGRQGAGTVGQEAFHDWLRETFDTGKSLGPLGFVNHLRTQLPSQVWDGNVADIPVAHLNQPIGVYYRTGTGIDGTLTFAQLAAVQRQNYQRILDDFLRVQTILNSSG